MLLLKFLPGFQISEDEVDRRSDARAREERAQLHGDSRHREERRAKKRKLRERERESARRTSRPSSPPEVVVRYPPAAPASPTPRGAVPAVRVIHPEPVRVIHPDPLPPSPPAREGGGGAPYEPMDVGVLPLGPRPVTVVPASGGPLPPQPTPAGPNKLPPGALLNVPEWFVREGGEFILGESPGGKANLRYWPKFVTDHGHAVSSQFSIDWDASMFFTSASSFVTLYQP